MKTFKEIAEMHYDSEPNNEFDKQYRLDRINALEKLLIEQFADAGRRELLFAFEDYWTKNNCDGEKFDEVVDRFLSNNSY